MADDDFTKGVEDGLRLSKRIYFGKDRSVAPPRTYTAMEKATRSFYPVSPMVYAVISNPGIVDNPDVPSYQPHVHGRCDPPALIPLQMNGIAIEVDCYLDTAFVTMSGSWRVHCVMGSASCDCRIAIPMGEEGSILGVDVDVPRKSYTTRLVVMDDRGKTESVAKPEDGGFLKPHIFTLTIPQIDGGSNLSVKVRWSQKIVYKDGEFTVKVPFSFPEYVTPAGKKLSKKEKIQLNVNVGLGTEVLCKTTSHALKERKREVGKLAFLYEAEVLSWSSFDFSFIYSVPSRSTFGGVLLQSPSAPSIDQREMFSLYLFPGPDQNKKACRKEVLFVVDISGSMKGRTIEATKSAVIASLSKLDQKDSFSIMAFNDETYLYSTTLELATKEAIDNAAEWIGMNFIPGGGTNMSIALDQAIEMLSGNKQSIPIIIFITDEVVENERQICEVMMKKLRNQGSDLCPRIYTFGIGSFCNQYFLRMLAMIGRGHHEASADADTIEAQMEALFSRISSTVVVNIAIDGLDDVDALEVYPSTVPDLHSDRPIIMYGHYKGGFPDKLKARGVLADMSNFTIDLNVQRTNDIPLDKILAKQQIELYTTHAWFSQDKELQEKVAKISSQTGVVSEYTRMILLETVQEMHATTSSGTKKVLAATQTPGEAGMNWFQGTADAVRQFTWVFEDAKNKDIEDILILSGDHLYRMDYLNFVQNHIDRNADITVACVPVGESRAPDFGLMKFDNTGQVIQFAEKPKDEHLQAMRVDTTLLGLSPEDAKGSPFIASMGVYVFKRDILLKLLRWRYPTSNDFGSEIIPAAVTEHNVQAYLFRDYWEDIGTIKSFYDANLALTNEVPKFQFYDPKTPFFTSPRFLPPSKIEKCKIKNAIISHGCFLRECNIEHSIVGERSRIDSGVELKDTLMLGADYYQTESEIASLLADGKVPIGVGSNTKIRNCIIDKNAKIGSDVMIMNKDGVEEGDRAEEGFYIRSGITIILEKATISDGIVI